MRFQSRGRNTKFQRCDCCGNSTPLLLPLSALLFNLTVDYFMQLLNLFLSKFQLFQFLDLMLQRGNSLVSQFLRPGHCAFPCTMPILAFTCNTNPVALDRKSVV